MRGRHSRRSRGKAASVAEAVGEECIIITTTPGFHAIVSRRLAAALLDRRIVVRFWVYEGLAIVSHEYKQ
jgi:hypothetical protein